MTDQEKASALKAFDEVIKRAGSYGRLAEALGGSRQQYQQARTRSGLFPPTRVLEAERHYGISRHVLRPDLHGAA